MGYERKRGKLADLNAFLRGRGEGRFSLVVGETAVLSGVKYVITLDTDTQLPRDSARQFVGVMAHPLNQARFGSAAGRDDGDRVTEGYGILQPRVGISLPGANRSRYARMHGGDAGIDPYTRAVSDVYQDVFGEGSFIGKGIYDVDAFERALGGRLPENRILSHDLIEGCYARSGLLSDVQLYEESPSTYAADVARRHRWIRGDWQLAGWLLPFVPGPGPRRLRNPLSALSLWKLFDNLRRSLVPAALTVLLLVGWAVLAQAWLWSLAIIAIMVLPLASAVFLDLLRKPDEMLLRQHLADATSAAGRHAAQTALTVAFLPYEATVNLDAIVRTAWRMLVSHRPLLEWNPSAADEPDRARRDDPAGRSELASAFKTMWSAPGIAAATAVLLAVHAPSAVAGAAPVLLLWLASPAIAWWVSRPLARREARLKTEQTLFLRQLARRTWAFFETFVGPDDHWLPPDNVQEHPVGSVAHRTSPTNMGLALLANLTAYDFGYLPAGALVLRTANALASMQELERYEGHFYNWYDTQTRKPLLPLYVSAVDSGNLAGHLMTLRAGLAALVDDPIMDRRWLDGLGDTLRTLVEAFRGSAPAPLVRLQRDLASAHEARIESIAAAARWLDLLAGSAREVVAQVPGMPSTNAGSPAPVAGDPAFWAEALMRQCTSLNDELAFLAPWSARPAAPPGSEASGHARDSDVARAGGARGRAAAGDRAAPAHRHATRRARLAGRSLPRGRPGERSRRPAPRGDRAPGAAMR
jgi:hypothetical protein